LYVLAGGTRIAKEVMIESMMTASAVSIRIAA